MDICLKGYDEHRALHSDKNGFFFFNDTATTEIYTLSLHDALPIYCRRGGALRRRQTREARRRRAARSPPRSEEHTSELQSQSNIVCRLLLEKKNIKTRPYLISADRFILRETVTHHTDSMAESRLTH